MLAPEVNDGGLHRFANPLRFQRVADAMFPWFGAATALLAPIAIYWALVIAPPDYQQGDAFRIVYVHAPSAWLSMLVYGTMAAATAR